MSFEGGRNTKRLFMVEEVNIFWGVEVVMDSGFGRGLVFLVGRYRKG